MIITIQIPHILHLKGKLFDSRGCLLLVRRDDFGSNKFTIYEMMKGSSVWSVRYHVDTDDFMTPLPEGWSIRFTVWSIVLGEMEDDSFLVINLSGKVVEYNLISKNLREMYDMESYQLTDVYHDGFIPHGFIPPFAMYDMRPKQVDHKNGSLSPEHVVIVEPHNEGDSDECSSDESYFSHLSSDDNHGHDEDDVEIASDKVETKSNHKKSRTMKVNSRFQNVLEFKRALNHHAVINEFEYFIEKSDLERVTARCAHKKCPWRIHASLMQDKVTFEVKNLKETHTCMRSNMGGNKHATQGWIASVLTDKIKSDGDATVTELKSWLMKNYNVNLPYHKVFRGKEQAYTDMYGTWDDSFIQLGDFKEELQNRNPGSVVDIDFEMVGGKKCFKRFFISLVACSKGFLAGCRPYISLDACHLKGKFNGVLAAATSIDGNNGIFPVAYAVLESENGNSWTWFLESLKKAIGTPDGLVISSDMQKGLELAIMQVYPNVEHRECMRHLYSNFKKQYRGDFFKSKLWGAANTYCIIEHERLLNEISSVREDAIQYLSLNHNKIWSRSKFGTASKCDYLTNNISEAFNSWIGIFRFQPVLDLLDNIREELLKRFDEKRMVVEKWNGTLVPRAKKYLKRISKASIFIYYFGEYEVCRSNDNHAEVKRNGKRWVVMLDEKKCSCRVWQVKGMPCVHAAAFIAFIRESWDNYVDPYFTIENFKDAYALEVAMMPGKDKWVHLQTEDKIYPPVIKRPIGRPRKKRIVAVDEPKKRQQCKQCGGYGHRQKSCKNPPA
ncbi:uncharacterized protein Tco_0570938 [Tanacetum coccineum]